MPRLEPPESSAWYAKVKAVPANSPNFDCILPGCPNSYQTKQGLERHFASIHMPKSDAAAQRAANRSSNTHSSSSHGSRKSHLVPRRRGRPPSSSLKARLKRMALQQEIPFEAQTEHHTNHSLLAHHPASTRHDYGGDDDNKPREERSYLEFFPFLNTSLRLDIVDIEQDKAQEISLEGATSAQDQGPNLEATGATKEGDSAVGEDIKPSVPESDSNEEKTHPDRLDEQSEPTVAFPEPLLEIQAVPGGEDMEVIEDAPTTMELDEDADGGAASESDVFFDAKGFSEAEAESAQKSILSPQGDTDGDTKGDAEDDIKDDAKDDAKDDIKEDTKDDAKDDTEDDIKDEAGKADVDQEPKALDETSDISVSVSETCISAERATENSNDDLQPNGLSASASESRPPKVPEAVPSSLVIKKPVAEAKASGSLEPKAPMSALPKSSFRRIPQDDDDLAEFHLPVGHNVRYIEPTETELAERVEYDMDEQDEFWLKEINAERRKQDLGEVSSSMFEKIIDRLEKEWFDLTKNIPKPTENLPPEDSACNICDDGECENSNAIVFCDGCNLAVHQDCYGIPYIPEGQWLCRKCMLSPQMPVSCIFCPSEGGAFKQTTNSRWAHLLCASWIPEVGVANTVYMEPIDNIEKIPASRWRLTCYICKLRVGACIQCETKNCFRAFHVTCARKAHLYMKSKLSKVSSSGGEVLVYRAHCHKHTPRDYKGVVDVAGAAAVFARKGQKKKRAKIRVIDDDSDDPEYRRSGDEGASVERRFSAVSAMGLAATSSLGGSRTSKAALAHQKHYSPGAPLAPMYIVSRLLPFVSKLGAKSHSQRKTSALNFIYTICKYWSLKRESRRGAPLLKRLHLEPWTASASAHRQTEEEKLKKLQTQVLLRGDLEKVRMLAELVRKRERAKLKRQELQNRYLCKIMFPLKTILEDALAELEKLDKQKYFAYPISAEEVKDYHDVIKNPICFQTMSEKLAGHKYGTVEEFADDARRIYQNCMLYNKIDTPYYRAASRQAKQAESFLQKAKEEYQGLEIDPRTGFLAVPIDNDIFAYDFVPFEKEATSEAEHQQGPPAKAPTSSTVTDGGAPKSHRRVSSSEPPKPPFVTGRSLRARGTPVEASSAQAPPSVQSPTSAQAPFSAPTLSIEARRALDQTPGFRAPSRSALRPEPSKPQTATKTRADVVRARLDAGKSAVPSKSSDEEDLLEQLKTKSKKSRTLAISLQSRLKPSIVDKAVVINKPAPKGWAYVVVEGEEDTTEGEDEDEEKVKEEQEGVTTTARREMTPLEAQAREEARLKKQAQAQKKKLDKLAKKKARAEVYARDKALKIQRLLEAAKTNQTSATKDSAVAARKSRLKYDMEEIVPRNIFTDPAPVTSRTRTRRGQEVQSKDGPEESISNGGADLDRAQSRRSKSRGSVGSEVDLLARDSKERSKTSASSVPSATKRSRQLTDESGHAGSDEHEDAADGKPEDMGAEISDQDVMDDASSRTTADEEPPRKRPKRFGSARGEPRDKQDEEGAQAASTRRLRSAETPPALPTGTRTRRGSTGGPKSVARGVGERTASEGATKRRRDDGREGVVKMQKSDKHGQNTRLPYGSLVWAKMDGFPWFPAELMDPKGKNVPTPVRELKREGGGEGHLVQFFDLRERGERGRSWYWVTPAQISSLGVDLEEDRKRVCLKANWSSKRRKSVKEAYLDACKQFNMDASLVISETT
ncbi:nuA3 HAT complex component nto1 [Mortierella alpina]|uniref:NuA3 HAT complex component nto1 n=1 Tax=Mortierella alpina TaxID=64518 RepID=A0A9P6J891_MORAP|nr:nuA3 HAT complex component nto1 [Mortierella alpina]